LRSSQIADGLKILCGLKIQVGTTIKKPELDQRQFPKEKYWPQRCFACQTIEPLLNLL
tara:strand:- start:324 stop:497 length:174 start_codon:yes stop_codon:yes gene_type:complete